MFYVFLKIEKKITLLQIGYLFKFVYHQDWFVWDKLLGIG